MPKANRESGGPYARRGKHRADVSSPSKNKSQATPVDPQPGEDAGKGSTGSQSLESFVNELRQQRETIDVVWLLESLKASRSMNQSYFGRANKLERGLAIMKQQKEDLESKLQATESKFKQEAASMSDRLETTERQLYRAQRHIRFFDQTSCFQHEIRSGSDYESTRRCKNYTPSPDCSQIIELVEGLNSAICQFAEEFASEKWVPLFNDHLTVENTRAEALLGKPILSILQGQVYRWKSFAILLEVVLRIFLVSWCSSIIEGWYPKRLTFLDLLVKLDQAQAGSQGLSLPCREMGQIITKSVGVDYHAWINDILGELPALLEMGGIEMACKDFSGHLLPILQKAYTIRTALAEKDIYGNVEISSATICAPFQPDSMEACYKAYDVRQKIPWENARRADQVIGNISLGLEVNELESRGRNRGSTTTRVILKPKVVLSDSIDFSPDKPNYSIIKTAPIFIL